MKVGNKWMDILCYFYNYSNLRKGGCIEAKKVDITRRQRIAIYLCYCILAPITTFIKSGFWVQKYRC